MVPSHTLKCHMRAGSLLNEAVGYLGGKKSTLTLEVTQVGEGKESSGPK